MENLPISALLYTDQLIYASGSKLKYGKELIAFDSFIKGIRSFKDNILVFTKNKITIFSKNNKIGSIKLDSDIVDVHLDTKVKILTSDGYFYIKSFQLNENITNPLKVFNKTIFSGQITDKKIIIGTFNEIYIQEYYKLENKQVLKYHQGRIFNIKLIDNEKLYSCGEERKVCLNGVKLIQNSRDYYYNLFYSKDNKLYAANKNGSLSVFEDQKLIFNINFGPENITAISENENNVLIGTKSGCIFRINNGEIYTLKGIDIFNICFNFSHQIDTPIKLFECGAYLKNGIIYHENFKITVLKFPIDVFIFKNNLYTLEKDSVEIFNIEKNEKEKIMIPQKLIDQRFSNISVHESFIFLHNGNYFARFCVSCLDFIDITEFNKISKIRSGIVCTKNGRIFYKSRIYKVSNDGIIDALIFQDDFYIIDHSGKLLIFNKSVMNEECNIKTCSCSNNINIDTINNKNNVIDIRNGIKTCSCSNNTNIDTINNAIDIRNGIIYKQLDPEMNGLCVFENKVFTLKRSKDISITPTKYLQRFNEKLIISNLRIETDPTLLYCDFTSKSTANAIDLLGNEHGFLFLIISKKIKSYIKLIGSIVGIFSTELNQFVVYTKQGYSYYIKVYREQIYIQKEIKFSHKVSSAFNDYACLSNGEILKSNKKICNQTIPTNYITAICGNIISYNGFVYDILTKKSEKITELAILKIKKYKNSYFACGDDHSIINFDQELKILNRKTVHSSQIFDICIYKEFVVSISFDMKICILDSNLNIKMYVSHNVRLPKIIEAFENKLVAYGESIEEINIDWKIFK